MYLIGLCGRSGSGKTAICGFLRKKGVYVIDADEVCRRLYKEDMDCISALSEEFGSDIAGKNGINRALLAKRAFSREGSIDRLNSISHRFIGKAILDDVKRAEDAGVRFTVLDAPTLFESGLNKKCDAVISVFSGKWLLYRRLKARENITRDMFLKRYNAQKTNVFLLENSTAVIKNTGTAADLRRRTLLAFMVTELKLGALTRGKGKKRYVYKKT